MGVYLGTTLLGLLFFLFGVAPFEAAIALMLLTPIASYPLAMHFGQSVYTYAAGALIITGAFLLLLPARPRLRISAANLPALIPLGFFLACFAVFNYFCHLWPDFYQLGERLRDYAVLSATIKSPVEPLEPWLAGAPLNYYLYWYRFGHFMYTLFGIPIWEVYHQLQSFTFALFTTTVFVIFWKFIRLPLWGAAFVSAAVALGSNWEGVRFFLKSDVNWWGPSRVIPGAINEFPAWSFLLGDVHPHYLNLGLIPFLCLLFLHLTRSALTPMVKLFAALTLLFVGALWVYNANAWEVPVWAAISVAFFALTLVGMPLRDLREFVRERLRWRELLSPPAAVLLALCAYLIISLSLSSLNIIPAEMPLRIVEDPIERSSVLDLLRHWGIPLGLITLANLALIGKVEVWVGMAFAIASSFFFGQAWVLLGFIIALTLFRLWWTWFSEHSTKRDAPEILAETFGLVALPLILFPELAFLDDMYGGENERMNTIFKAYSASWVLLHAYAFYLLTRLPLGKLRSSFALPALPFLIVIIVLWGGFFARTVKLRKGTEPTVRPYEQGLSDIERRFPGSSTAIQILVNSRPGVVLEAQGPAYDFTTHVATLSSQPAYLGWINHVNLLLKMGEEVNRRAGITETFYREADCERRRQLAVQERIKYIVVGPLERKAYGDLPAEGFQCFEQIVKAREYAVYQTPL